MTEMKGEVEIISGSVDDDKDSGRPGRRWTMRAGDIEVGIALYGIENVHEDKDDYMEDLISSLHTEAEVHLSNAGLINGTPDVKAFSNPGRHKGL